MEPRSEPANTVWPFPLYEVTGTTTDGRRASVVCRFLTSGVLLIITAYVHEEGAL